MYVPRIFGHFFFLSFFSFFPVPAEVWGGFFFLLHTYIYVTSLGSKIRSRIKIDIDDGLIEVFFCLLWLVALGSPYYLSTAKRAANKTS